MLRAVSGPIVLSSASPRRAELLASAGISFTVRPSAVAEERRPDEAPAALVLRLARAKARKAAERAGGRFVLGADTVVALDGEALGKPRDRGEAEQTLRRLSGRVHEVMTGFEVYDRGRGHALGEVVTTRVEFKALHPEEIRAYAATGCSRDAAGAYAIQGPAAYMVRRVEGSYTNVVGLPLCEVVEALLRAGAVSL